MLQSRSRRCNQRGQLANAAADTLRKGSLYRYLLSIPPCRLSQCVPGRVKGSILCGLGRRLCSEELQNVLYGAPLKDKEKTPKLGRLCLAFKVRGGGPT